jgi:alpha/beta superfamily hydrolase
VVGRIERGEGGKKGGKRAMGEKEVFFDAGGVKIEGLWEDRPGGKAVVVTHPHPQYGGDMYNNVVEAVVEVYGEKGCSTLRFNFRGMGRSQGRYENGAGEQKDVAAALAYVSSLGKGEIDLAGYSFGAWVDALGLDRFKEASRLVMISPPVNFIDFSFLKQSPKVRLVIAGSRDDIAPPAVIEKMLPAWNEKARFEVIESADHFYGGKIAELKAVIRGFLEEEE